MRSYRQMKDVGKAHYYEAKAEACERRSAEHAFPVRPAGIGAILWLLPVLSRSAGLSGLSPRRAAERHGVRRRLKHFAHSSTHRFVYTTAGSYCAIAEEPHDRAPCPTGILGK
jgi:hypothetical protein